VAVANTSIALLAVTVLWFSPGAIWLLGIPVATMFLAYRAWVSEREKHERLELVYQSSRILQHSPELDVALLALLDHARTMFRAELAEVVLDSGGEAPQTLRSSSHHDGASEALVPIERMDVGRQVVGLIEGRRAGFVTTAQTPGGQSIRPRPSMVAPLVGEAGVIGLFTIANRLTEGTEFAVDDLRLLETLANQAAVALENGQLEQSLAELSRLKEKLRYQAYHDPLTDMPNRVAFSEAATARIRGEWSDDLRPAILLLDLDDFKNVNDTLGHAAGDELLVMVAERIRTCVRSEDLAARLGGDEFAVLLSDRPTLAHAVGIAERLVAAMAVAFPVHGTEVVVGASVGIAMSTGPDQSPDELLSNADVAMYTAKAAGRRRFAVFDPNLHSAIIARHELSAQLTMGIARSELLVLYQPIVALDGGQTVGLEALVRWRHPTRGLVEPDEFIALAEESGAIVPLGNFVLREAAQQVQDCNGRPGGPSVYLSVNVSAVQLQQPTFLDEVEEVLRSTCLRPEHLVLEITESAMFRDTAATIEKLRALRERGVRISVDDFGTGYASLSYLRRFPVDALKIAKDFIGPAHTDGPEESPEWAFTGAILALGRRLGLDVIAEGIEEPGQLLRLREMGCEYGQGFLFARPAPFVEIARVLRPAMPHAETATRLPLRAAANGSD
jgi:diguanylate cyclase (GGDEF)-like protein